MWNGWNLLAALEIFLTFILSGTQKTVSATRALISAIKNCVFLPNVSSVKSHPMVGDDPLQDLQNLFVIKVPTKTDGTLVTYEKSEKISCSEAWWTNERKSFLFSLSIITLRCSAFKTTPCNPDKDTLKRMDGCSDFIKKHCSLFSWVMHFTLFTHLTQSSIGGVIKYWQIKLAGWFCVEGMLVLI